MIPIGFAILASLTISMMMRMLEKKNLAWSKVAVVVKRKR